VALARALVFKPSLMLLDEPLSALDKNLRVSMQDELKNLHQRVGLTFVCVTHDQEEALSLADEVAILHRGRLVQSGAPSDLYERPASRFVAGFLGRSNFWRAEDVTASGDRFSYSAGGAMFQQHGAVPPGPVLIALRPEKLMALPAAGAGPINRVTGTVVMCSYLGDAWLVQVDVPALGRLQLVIPTWRGSQPRPGETMQLGWDPDASVAVTDDEGL
jgi:putative spermidine/putrescine transport system ATP-binding protein